MSCDGESMATLKARIKELQDENNLLKRKVHSGKSLVESAGLHEHEFKIEYEDDRDEVRSEVITVNDVELSVRLEKKKKPEKNVSSYIRVDSLHLKNLDEDKYKFAMTTMEVLSALGPNGGSREQRAGNDSAPMTFVLGCSDAKKESERNMKTIGDMTEYSQHQQYHQPQQQNKYVFRVRVTLAVESISPMDVDDDTTTVVVVGNKEFSVSAQYLSMWSGFFRAYFRSDMREKKEGRFPIKDKDITPEDFEELLMVIYPSDKPISAQNYKKLLKMASRFEMPQLTRRIEMFLVDLTRNGLDPAGVFRLATSSFPLKLVQASLLRRWKCAAVLEKELLKSPEYKKLCPETKAMINERFAESRIATPGQYEMRYLEPYYSEDEEEVYDEEEYGYSEENSGTV